MQVKLHQDVLGARSGDTITVDATQWEWLKREGYASIEGDDEDKALMRGVPADADPTQAANREKPGELDVNSLEDDASNDDNTKRADAESRFRPKSVPATAKRPEGQQRDETPGGAGEASEEPEPIDESATATESAEVTETPADDSEASEA